MKPRIKNFLLMAALFLVAVSVFVYRNKTDKDAAIYLNSGRAKLANGDLDGALADFNKSIELKPDDAAAYGDLGFLKQSKGDLDGALADLNKAIKFKPNYAGAYLSRGFVKRFKGDLDGALVDFNKAIEIAPNSTDNDVTQNGDPSRALADFDAMVYVNRGEVKQLKGDLDGALVDFNKGIELNPSNPKYAITYANRGAMKYVRGDTNGAKADFEKAIALNPAMLQLIQAKGYLTNGTNSN